MSTTEPAPAISPDELLTALRSAGIATVLAGDDPAAADALRGFNLSLTHRPDAVVAPADAAQVAEVVAIAQRAGVHVTAFGLNHGFLAPVVGGIAMATKQLASVEIDADLRVARVGAGASWQQVLDAATPLGLAPICGSSPAVGVVGYTLGGGIGPISRTVGFAADHVRAIEVVTPADGRVTASADERPEHFWALRGGKFGLGIVTAIEFELLPIATLTGGGMFFEGDAEVVRRWRDWSADAPESLSTSVAIVRLPPFDEVPEPIRGKTVVHVRAAVVGDDVDARAMLEQIPELGTPLLGGFGELPYAAIGSIHGDPTDPSPSNEGGMLLAGLPDEAFDALMSAAGPAAEVPLVAVELRLYGGALARPADPENATAGRGAAYSLFVVGAPDPAILETVVPQVIGGVLEAMQQWQADELQPNFVGRSNPGGAIANAWTPAVTDRLAAVRDQVDPDRILR